MQQLRSELGMSIILITHDLGVVAEMADRVVVMYAGQVVESAPADVMFEIPGHPYTLGLLKSVPMLNETRPRLQAIEGMVPSLFTCPSDVDLAHVASVPIIVASRKLPLVRVALDHEIRCFRPLL